MANNQRRELTPEEIAKACEEIQATWSAETELQRKVQVREWEVARYRIAKHAGGSVGLETER